MNGFGQLLPTLLAGAAIIVIALRAMFRAQRADKAHKLDWERRMAELEQRRDARLAAEAAANRPRVLQVTLELGDPDAVPEVGRLARDAERLIAAINTYDESLGGQGFVFSEGRAEPGRVIVTLAPKEASGSAQRVSQIADALNSAFDATESADGEASVNVGGLRGEVSGARAVALAA